jgi:hypothetical protein
MMTPSVDRSAMPTIVTPHMGPISDSAALSIV